jgi:kynurenine 3-monooxygenase
MKKTLVDFAKNILFQQQQLFQIWWKISLITQRVIWLLWKCFLTHNDVALIQMLISNCAFYGWMIAGFEDITQFYRVNGEIWWWLAKPFFTEYANSRKPNAIIVELSHRNFMEMSTKTAWSKFSQKRKLKKNRFQKISYRQMDSLYSRVTFSHQPYAEVLWLVIGKTKLCKKF